LEKIKENCCVELSSPESVKALQWVSGVWCGKDSKKVGLESGVENSGMRRVCERE